MDTFTNSDWIPLVWFGIGIVLLIVEVLGAAGFLVGAAAAALVLALLTFLIDGIGVPLQLGVYAIVAVFATLVYFRFFRKTQGKNDVELPARSSSMLGKRFTLEERLAAGAEIRAQIGDTMWRVGADQDLAEGTEVKVISAEAMSVKVEAIT